MTLHQHFIYLFIYFFSFVFIALRYHLDSINKAVGIYSVSENVLDESLRTFSILSQKQRSRDDI